MMLKRMIIRIYIFLMNLNKKNYNFFNLNQRENSCFPIYFLFFKLIFLIWSSPGVSAFCTPDEISWSFICRSCLNCPPVSLGSSTLIACDLFSGKGNIVVVGYNDPSNWYSSLMASSDISSTYPQSHSNLLFFGISILPQSGQNLIFSLQDFYHDIFE